MLFSCSLCMFAVLATVFSSGSQECTQGFMDYELLSVKAAQIGDSSIDDTVNGLDNSTYVMPSLNFTCSGTITGFLLAVDIRIYNYNLYPWIALFNKIGNSNTSQYSRVSSNHSIILGADNFSTSGLYNYTLSSPIQFTSGNIIGVYQPNADDSVVVLQMQSYGTDDIEAIHYNKLTTDYDFWHYLENSRLLLIPIEENTNCLSDGFISYEDLQMNARLVTFPAGSYTTSLGPHRFFKEIGFTCNCSITHVIAGMKDDISQSSNPSAIKIWRKNNTNNDYYIQSGPTIPLYYSDAVSDISTDYLRWYNLSVPIPVKKGDVLGIYFFIPITKADAVIYHQVFSGPRNYRNTSTIYQETGSNIYPLVSVVVSIASLTSTSTSTIDQTTYVSASFMIITVTTAHSKIPVITPNATTISTITTADNITYSNTEANTIMLFTPTTGPNQPTSPVIIPVITTVCFVLLLSFGNVLIICIVCYYKSKSKKRMNAQTGENVKQQATSEGLDDGDNPCEMNEAYGAIDQMSQHTYDYIAVSNDTGSDSLVSLIQMNSNDSYAMKQEPIYIEGNKANSFEQSIYIEGLTVNESYGVKQPSIYIEGRRQQLTSTAITD